jgi:prepilin-type N-terminal cleavage/methylation domain-containing protein
MKREHGFTLVELLVTIAITGVIFSVIGGVVYQLTTVGEYGNDRLDAAHELQNAAYWFNLDGQRAVTASGGGSLVLTLPPPAGDVITYALSDTNLQRTSAGSTMTLARNISGASFVVLGKLVTMDITASVPGRMGVSEQGTYKVYLRPVAP